MTAHNFQILVSAGIICYILCKMNGFVEKEPPVRVKINVSPRAVKIAAISFYITIFLIAIISILNYKP